MVKTSLENKALWLRLVWKSKAKVEPSLENKDFD